MDEKSSFLKRTLSKEDAIIQIFRPMLANRVGQAMDLLDRQVSEAETLIILGTEMGVQGQKFFITPEDLKNNLDEYKELEQIAVEGRAFLNSIGYVPRRKNAPPFVGAVPVGKTVDIMPITTQLPGKEPLQGVVITPKKKDLPSVTKEGLQP